MTHDEALIERIKSIRQYLRKHKMVDCNTHSIIPHLLVERIYLGSVNAVIISQPHGQPKRITMGKLISTELDLSLEGVERLKYWYETATCPGSSGAPIILVDRLYFAPWLGHVHSGAYNKISTKVSKQLNYCNSLGYFV